MVKIVNTEIGSLPIESLLKELQKRLNRWNVTILHNKEKKEIWVTGKKVDLISFIAFYRNIEGIREIAFLVTDKGEYL
ncbi:MAG: hypothetical protein J6N70_16450 [Oribacterium sp.]|jgi:hypothetical protein|nr:hypothetical protein [Oribacterium sp.]